MENFIEMTGDVVDIIYKNESNGYTVCVLKTTDKEVTAVGNIPYINAGDKLKLSGNWVLHKDYGNQFKVTYFEKCEPDTCESIERSLASGLIKGIGPITAKKIVERFGIDTLQIIESHPDKLSDIKGISLSKAKEIGNSYKEKAEAQRVIIAFQEYGITPGYAMKIYSVFGNESIKRLKENPYCLTDEVFGIGFKTADAIAMKLGMDMSSDSRVAAGIKYILSKAASSGHTYLPEQYLVEKASELLGVMQDQTEYLLSGLAMDMHITVEHSDEGRKVYLTAFYIAEKNAAIKLLDLSRTQYRYKQKDLDERIVKLEKKNKIQLDDLQKEAVKQAVTNGVTVITGGPGTGKTTIINTIICLLKDEGKEISLTAPTGRAAKRMTQATGYEAKTIHRLLEIGYMENDDSAAIFTRDENNPLNVSAVIIDEMSMVDILLFNNLLKAVPLGTRLIMVGDANQLPSVGPGNVLRDIITGGVINTVKLNRIYRQNENSMITVNAHNINNGILPDLDNKSNDFFFIKRNSMDKLVGTVVELCTQRLPNTYGYNSMEDIQILTPLRKGPAGVEELNIRLQSVLNPADINRKEFEYRGFVYRECDKIMQVKNNYQLTWVLKNDDQTYGEGIFNGDMGIIEQIDDEARVAKILFEDKVVYYEFVHFDELEPAYAVTVHKSQGSEFPAVILPVYPGPPMLMTRNLLYTAVTRAKNIVVIVGNQTVLKGMIDNVRELKRYCGLKDKIIAFNNVESFI